ncbi:hypothetical protein DBB30_34060, partial [Yersinia pestis]
MRVWNNFTHNFGVWICLEKFFCRKYQADMEGLDFAPFPGPKGQELFDTVSKQAWQEW